MKLIRAGLTTVIFWSWMVNARTSSFIARIRWEKALPGDNWFSWWFYSSCYGVFLALLIYPLVCVEPGLRRRAFHWTRSSGGVRRGHCLRGSLGVHQITGKCTTIRDGIICSTGCCWKLLYMLVLVRLPSLHDNYAYTVSWNEGALWGTCRQTHSKTSFSPVWGFLLCRNSLYWFWGAILWYLWVGRARHPGPRSLGVSVELFNVGG